MSGKVSPPCPCPEYQIEDAEGEFRGTVPTLEVARSVIARAWSELREVWSAEEACNCPDGTGCHLIPWERIQ
jgi:hypothetical protein